ncbi:substrate binding domain-containing protein [Aliamphritea spongicola]|nr:substrate binding domain-containing protein [Aliamphritea spongicola]
MQLLNRSTRSLSLTDEGRSYYAYCKAITEQAASAQQQMENFRQVPEGLLKITCPVNMGLQIIVPALNEFKQRYPRIELDIVLADQVVNILEEGIDLAIRGAPLADSSLQAVQLAVLKTHICGSPAYFRKHGRPLSPEDLSRHNWIMYQLSSGSLELRKGNVLLASGPKGISLLIMPLPVPRLWRVGTGWAGYLLMMPRRKSTGERWSLYWMIISLTILKCMECLRRARRKPRNSGYCWIF